MRGDPPKRGSRGALRGGRGGQLGAWRGDPPKRGPGGPPGGGGGLPGGVWGSNLGSEGPSGGAREVIWRVCCSVTESDPKIIQSDLNAMSIGGLDYRTTPILETHQTYPSRHTGRALAAVR